MPLASCLAIRDRRGYGVGRQDENQVRDPIHRDPGGVIEGSASHAKDKRPSQHGKGRLQPHRNMMRGLAQEPPPRGEPSDKMDNHQEDQQRE